MPIATASVTYLGHTTHRNSHRLFGIRQADRRMHLVAVGKSGSGKSHLLRIVAEQDILANRGFALFDPHGDLAQQLKDVATIQRPHDLVYIDPKDDASEWRFNPFANVPRSDRALAANGIVDVFKKLWADDWGPRTEHLLRNVAHTLLDTPGSTLADIPGLLTDRTTWLDAADMVENPAVRDFWNSEFDKYSQAFRVTVTAPLLNKVGAFLTDPNLRRFLTEPGRLLNLRQSIDRGTVMLVNLDKGRLGETAASLLGSLLLSGIGLAGLGRSNVGEEQRRDFAVLFDECQLFTTQALANMLSELRKYRVSMMLATQYLSALEPTIRDAIFGNAGTIVTFRVGAVDAAYLARELGQPLTHSDLTNLPRYNVYIRLLIDGEPSRPFSALILGSTATTGDP